MFLGIKCYVKCEWFMNKPLSKNLQNIDGNKIVKFGVCKCCRSGRKNLSLAFKDMHCKKNKQKKKHLNVYFRCFFLV